MTNSTPQLDNGYVKIANEILEHLYKINLTSYQMRIILFIFRKTYGYNKKEDWISVSQIVEGTGIKQSHVSRTKKELLDKNILYTPTGIKIAFQKDWRLWKINIPNEVYRKNIPVQVKNIPSEDKNIPVQGNTKDNIQKTITKDSKNSKTACTEEDIKDVSILLDVSLDDVKRTHQIIMNKIEAKEFKGKTVYYSLKNWVLMGIERGTIKKNKGITNNYKLLKTV